MILPRLADAFWQGWCSQRNEMESKKIFSLTLASIRPGKCFCFYLTHTPVLLQPWHGGASHKMAACASNSPFKERREEGGRRGAWGREKKTNVMRCKQLKECNLLYNSFTAHPGPSLTGCLQTSPLSYPASSLQPLQLFAILTGCCTFKPPPALSSAWL